MRCKNCGTENDDKRYICENCGSPLYDEEDFDTPTPVHQTQDFDNAASNGNGVLPPVDNNNNNNSNNENKLAEKKSIIVIAILVVLLVAIIASVAVVASSKKKNEDSTSSSSSISQTLSTKQSTTKKYTTESTTEKETTTESTTVTTTTTTTKQQSWSVKLVSQGGGIVDGSGSYRDGDNVTITATPDDGYEFDGWYSNGTKISSTMRYSFTASEDISISAVFSPVSTTEPIEEMDGGMD